MPSSNSLKYKIEVNKSLYSGLTVFTCYLLLTLLLLYFYKFNILSITFLLLSLLIALLSSFYLYSIQYQLEVSNDCKIEVSFQDEKTLQGHISRFSFHNAFCLFILIDPYIDELTENKKRFWSRRYILVYKDSVPKSDFRVLARLINLK